MFCFVPLFYSATISCLFLKDEGNKIEMRMQDKISSQKPAFPINSKDSF